MIARSSRPGWTTLAVGALVISLALASGAQPSAASPSAAGGLLVAVRGQGLVDGNTFTIDDGAGVTSIFEFDSNGSVGAGNIAVAFSASDNAGVVRNRIVLAINNAPLAIDANPYGAAGVSLNHQTPGPAGNLPIVENVAAPEFIVLGMSGGMDEVLPPYYPSASTGMIVAVRAQWLADGDRFTISAGDGLSQTFEFDTNGSVAAGNTGIAVDLADNAVTVANKMKNAINLTSMGVSAGATSTAKLVLFNDQLGPTGNLPLLESVGALEFTIAGMSGGSAGTVGVVPSPAGAAVRVFPNPFRASMVIELGSRAGRPGVVRLLDARGGVIKVFAAGGGLPSRVQWDGTDGRGLPLPAGVYLYEVVSPGAPAMTGRFVKLR